MRLLLTAGEVIELGQSADLKVGCETGACWLTVSGKNQDVILKSGQRWAATGAAQTVLMAFTDAQIDIASAALQTGPATAATPRLAGNGALLQ